MNGVELPIKNKKFFLIEYFSLRLIIKKPKIKKPRFVLDIIARPTTKPFNKVFLG